MIADGFDPTDELFHPHPTDLTVWNESWLLSFVNAGADDGGLFRVGLLPNQDRAWLWLFFAFDGDWFAIEETDLRYSRLDTSTGVSYEHADLSFEYRTVEPFVAGAFRARGVARQLTGNGAPRLRPVAVELNVTATGPCFDTGLRSHVGEVNGAPQEFSVRRFEQPIRIDGTITDGQVVRPFAGFGQRDRSWGPRQWGTPFALGELHGPDLQLWFAGSSDLAGGGIGYTVRNNVLNDQIDFAGSSASYGDEGQPEAVQLHLTEPGRESLQLELEPLTAPLQFRIAQEAEPYEHYDYARTLVRAHRSDGGAPLTGWFEANRVGLS